MWSVSNVVGGRCFAFLLVSGRFLFLRMVGDRCLNQYMVGGRWLMVDGRSRWLVGGRWFCTTPCMAAILNCSSASKSLYGLKPVNDLFVTLKI